MLRAPFISADDWKGMYVNGKLVIEGHSLRYDEVLKILGVEFEHEYADEEWLYKIGRLPENLKDVETHI